MKLDPILLVVCRKGGEFTQTFTSCTEAFVMLMFRT